MTRPEPVSISYKYLLSQMNPRDGIVPRTEVDDRRDKAAVDRRRYCQHVTVQFIAPSLRLCRAS